MNRGAQRLAKLCAKRGAQKRIAVALDVNQGHLSRVIHGRVPGLAVRQKLRDHLGIPIQWWDENIDGERAA